MAQFDHVWTLTATECGGRSREECTIKRLLTVDTRSMAPGRRRAAITAFLEQSKYGGVIDPARCGGDYVTAAGMIGAAGTAMFLSEYEVANTLYTPAAVGESAISVRLTVSGGNYHQTVGGRRVSGEPGKVIVSDTSDDRYSHVTAPTWRCSVQVRRSELRLADRDLDRLLSGGATWQDWHTTTLVTTARALLRSHPTPSEVDDSGLDMYLTGLASFLIRSALGIREEPKDPAAARRERAVRFIIDNIADPRLSPKCIAAALGISLRHLGREFGGDGIAATIWRTRLDVAHQMLGDPELAHVSVGGVATRCGFLSSAHFSRAFRKRYGYSPSELRREWSLVVQAGGGPDWAVRRSRGRVGLGPDQVAHGQRDQAELARHPDRDAGPAASMQN